MTRTSLCYVLAAVSFAVAVHPAAGAQNQETMYYANADADHYGVPRALVDAISVQETGWAPFARSV